MSKSLTQGLRVLELVARSPRTAAEVARELGVDRSTGWRVLQVLAERGWVRQEEGSSAFSLNVTHLYELAGNGHRHLALPGLVTPALTGIRDRLGESAVLGVPSRSSMVYLVFVQSLHPVTVREAVGWVRPMHASALGKAYLSALDDDELEETLASLDFVGGTERAVKSAPELRYAVATVREAGYATDLEECLPGVVCVAAPLRLGKDKLLVGAVGISGPRERLMALGLDAAARAIREEIRQLESSVVGEAAHHP